MLKKLKNSNCDLTKKTCIVTSQKLKVWQKIKNSKYDNSKTRNVAKLRNSNSDKTQAFILWQTQKLKFWQNIKTQIGQDLKTQIVTKLKNPTIQIMTTQKVAFWQNSSSISMLSTVCSKSWGAFAGMAVQRMGSPVGDLSRNWDCFENVVAF